MERVGARRGPEIPWPQNSPETESVFRKFVPSFRMRLCKLELAEGSLSHFTWWQW
jgi:hypothetical protein